MSTKTINCKYNIFYQKMRKITNIGEFFDQKSRLNFK